MRRIIKQSYWLFLLTSFVLCLKCQTILASQNSDSLQEFYYELSINNIKYTGTYVGETKNGKPSGEGMFTTDDNSFKQFIYEGEFENGTFNGEGTITYAKDNKLKCTFETGVPTGSGEIIYPDGSYTKIKYDSGIPYGIATTYSADSEMIGYDFYYGGESISKLQESALAIDYQLLFKEPDTYCGDILRINCTVVNVYDDESTCYFKVEDEDGNIYWGAYSNLTYNKYYQAIMPALKKGDRLELYGFFYDITSYNLINDLEGSNYYYPQLVPVMGITEDFCVDRENPSYDYNEILRFPYYYYNLKKSIKGTVESVIYNGEYIYLKIADKSENRYYVSIAAEDIQDDDILVLGSQVKIKGRYKGLYKEKRITADVAAVSYVFLKGLDISCLDN